jgi:hypothetical protein
MGRREKPLYSTHPPYRREAIDFEPEEEFSPGRKVGVEDAAWSHEQAQGGTDWGDNFGQPVTTKFLGRKPFAIEGRLHCNPFIQRYSDARRVAGFFQPIAE